MENPYGRGRDKSRLYKIKNIIAATDGRGLKEPQNSKATETSVIEILRYTRNDKFL
jgi:hypothetical protein